MTKASPEIDLLKADAASIAEDAFSIEASQNLYRLSIGLPNSAPIEEDFTALIEALNTFNHVVFHLLNDSERVLIFWATLSERSNSNSLVQVLQETTPQIRAETLQQAHLEQCQSAGESLLNKIV